MTIKQNMFWRVSSLLCVNLNTQDGDVKTRDKNKQN